MEHNNSALTHLETVDDTLRGLCTTLEVMAGGLHDLANGEYMEDILRHVCHSLRDARAELDEATSVVMRSATA